ncbi:MAG: GTP-binding protein LepA, GTP-binding protein LepA [Parcubacteria group bacterium GW2011_GWC1_43_61]|nr:MAG: GTP-binding protein LepA, GTP-binding protein LepA [Parcubacteria group bacterium GW2011_GWC1_43_61]
MTTNIKMNIRNFVIIAHIDHGKSTLADRFLEITGTVSQRKMREQFLDQMDLERERGITIKMQPVRMNFKYNSEDYILNLIDTPGHVDFTYEVSRALAAVEGAILLVDATQGIQAQTIANLYLAKKENLKIIGVINKLDLVDDPEKIEMLKQEIAKLTDQKPEEILAVSAKTGLNAEKILEKVIEKFPEPKINIEKPFQALVFDSHFDAYKGVLAYIRVVEGEISKQKLINALATKSKIQILETGVFKPELTTVEKLSSGEIGYIATGLKNPTLVRVGDTLATNPNAEPLPGYTEPKSMVWASFYPEAADDFDLLGRGFRLGFLGMLHLDITAERLKREYNRQVIITTPTVSYRIKNRRKEILEIFTPADWPDSSQIESIEEPWIRLGILMPTRYLGGVMNLVGNYRGVYRQTDYLGMDHLILNFDIPLSDILVDFHDRLKSASEGYASMNYEFLGYKPGSLVKLQVLIAGESVEAFSKIVSKEKAYNEGNALVKKLKDIVPKQYFPVALQAAIGGKVIARETIPAMRKDVTGYLYGGDVTRKNKLLEKQKKGKKRRATFNRVQLDSEVYLKMFRNAQ